MKNRVKKKGKVNVVASRLGESQRFPIEEAYKRARANLSYSILKTGCKVILVTSAMNDEGKTTTSVNLAVTMAQQIKTRVLLIDCDLRKPRINRFFERENAPGLTDLLFFKCETRDVVVKTDTKNLFTLCSGTIPPNPSEILSSESMPKLLEAMKKNFDYIIIDTSPLNLVSDALSLAKLSDGVILSVMHGKSTHPELSKTIDVLKRADAKILGFILHGAKRGKKYSYGYYGQS